ncbi:MAG: shikimate kinase [Hyphomicrobiales bacterium]
MNQTVAHAPTPAKLLSFEVGHRVRALRRDRKLTRRQLADATGISERYLGQLENGQANASLNILHRIASHFGEPIAALIPVDARAVVAHRPLAELVSALGPREQNEAYQMLAKRFGAADTDRKGIALVGLRGAGKTTLGEELSELTGVPFLRLSQLVAERAGLDTSEIMELGGANAFRRFECEALQDLIDRPGKVILETSGGIVADDGTYDLLSRSFHTVWLRAEPNEHMQRVIDQNDLRPFAGRSEAMKDLMGLLSEREQAYGKADDTLETSGRSIRECLSELVEISKPVICA